MNLFKIIFLWIPGLALAQSQELYMPLNVKKTYDNDTRTITGGVSGHYWQNKSSYFLRATIDPSSRTLVGKAEVIYYNESPHTLDKIVLQAYHNYYKSNAARLWPGFYEKHSGMILDSLYVEDRKVDLHDWNQINTNGTNYTISLQSPLAAGDSLRLAISWRYSIPYKNFISSGAIDSTSMFIGYWYPEIAVYDDIDGWDTFIYDGGAEFYHDFSDFKVEITVPDHFMVWASVAPSNKVEVYSEMILKRLGNVVSDTGISEILHVDEYKKVGTSMQTWKYKAKSLPDFSFAISDHFEWYAVNYRDTIGDYFLQAVFPKNHGSFRSVPEAMTKAIQLMHSDFPSYPFPFKYFTIFNGIHEGGMEFPGMANNHESMDAAIVFGRELSAYEQNLFLSLHEMAHSYFPFLVGINEKKYGWMDEGMAMFSSDFIPAIYASHNEDKQFLGHSSILPMMTPTIQDKQFVVNAYFAAPRSINALYALLGKKTFAKCIRSFIDEWKYKHPTPYDFFNLVNREADEDLSWFWKNWYFDWGHIDLAIDTVKNNFVTVSNIGGRAVSSSLKIIYSDGTKEVVELSPLIWKDNAKHTYYSDKNNMISEAEINVLGGDALSDNNKRFNEEQN